MTPSDWLHAFESAVRRRDYVDARELFNPAVIAFGTVVPFACGVWQLETEQWRKIWEITTGFTFGAATIDTSGELATICAMWTSFADATLRAGRSTIVLRRDNEKWRAIHTHFSLTPVR